MARARLEMCYGDAPLAHKFWLTLDTYGPELMPVDLMWEYSATAGSRRPTGTPAVTSKP